jgi:hypothetical protein
MSFRVPKNIEKNATGNITNININFAAVEAELNDLGFEGLLNSGEWITNDHWVEGTIKTARFADVLTGTLTSSTTSLVTGNAVKKYVDSKT